MKKWKDAKSAADKRAVFAEALKASGGNQRRMAAMLGLARETVCRMMKGHTTHNVGPNQATLEGHHTTSGHTVTPVTRVTPVTPGHTAHTGAPSDTGAPGHTADPVAPVTPTGPVGLPGPGRAPSFPTVASEPLTERPREVDGLRFAPHHFRWLKRRAAERDLERLVRDPEEGRGGGMSAVLAELIQAAIDRESTDRESEE